MSRRPIDPSSPRATTGARARVARLGGERAPRARVTTIMLFALLALLALLAACGGPSGAEDDPDTGADAADEAAPNVDGGASDGADDGAEDASGDEDGDLPAADFGGVERVVTADGALQLPVAPQPLSFPASGTVLGVFVEPGDRVEEDQELARMDLTPLDLAVADARAALASATDALDEAERGAAEGELASARAELANAEAALARAESGSSLESARLEVERAKNSLWGQQAQRDSTCGQTERGFATEAACDAAQASVQAGEQAVQIAEQSYQAAQAASEGELAAARARVQAARASLGRLQAGSTEAQLEAARARAEQAQASYDQAMANRERASLRAPYDGAVVTVHVDEGVDTAPGAPAVTLARTSPLRFVTSNLGERNVALVEEGAPARVTLTAYPERLLDARVRRIASRGETDASGAIVYPVYLEVEAEDLPLRAGMTGRVEIVAEP